MKTSKNQIIALAIILTALTFTSCEKSIIGIRGNGPIVSQEIDFVELSGINMNIAGNVHIIQSDTQLIVVKAQQNIIDNLNTKVNHGIVDFNFDRNVISNDGIDIYMSLKTLIQANLSGSGSINTTSPFITDGILHLNLSGSGNFNIEVDATEVYSTISGSGDFTIKTNTEYFEGNISGTGKYIISGEATVADYTISGCGEISAFELLTKQTNIDVSGAGNSSVFASEVMNVEISGSGDVYYKGQPKINTNISGAGNIKNANWFIAYGEEFQPINTSPLLQKHRHHSHNCSINQQYPKSMF